MVLFGGRVRVVRVPLPPSRGILSARRVTAMRLHVLGSSGGYSAVDNPSSGFLLEHGATRLWMDAGHSTFGALQRVADFKKLDALVLSHLHPDHCADLYAAHVALRYRVDGPL